VSSSDFRQIAIQAGSGKDDAGATKAERLFRAAVSAFCSLPRPSRREITQLEDLTLPLFEHVSAAARRFVAAALSECEYPPTALVRRLAEEPVEIAAPLLIRSHALSDVDLIALIGRHGLPHARAIACRKGLNAAIAALIRALERPTLVGGKPSTDDGGAMPVPRVVALPVPRVVALPSAKPAADAPRTSGSAAEETRSRLRSMMAEESADTAAKINPLGTPETYPKLRETALSGNAVFFSTALADALGVDFITASSLTASGHYSALLTALRALDLGEDKAFLITVAVFPKLFSNPQAIRQFLDRYRSLRRDAALTQLRNWKADALSGMASADAQPQAEIAPPGNSNRSSADRTSRGRKIS